MLIDKHNSKNLLQQKSKLPLYFLLFIFIFPIIASHTLYAFRNHIPFKTIEKGHLLSSPIPSQDLPFFQPSFLEQWQIIYLSDSNELFSQSTVKATAILRKIHLALGKESHRVAYRSVSFQNTSALPFVTGSVAIMDPKGWLIMHYDSIENPQSILKDIRRLLRYSHGG